MSTNFLLKSNDDNVRQIIAMCAGRIELQQLVMGHCNDYLNKNKGITNSDGSVAVPSSGGQLGVGLVQKRKARGAKKPRADPTLSLVPIGHDVGPDAAGKIDEPDRPLPKACKKYSGWTVAHFVALFAYVEPRIFNTVFKVFGRSS